MAVFTALIGAISAISGWTIAIGSLGTFAIGNFILRSAVQLGLSALAKAFAGDGPKAQPFSIQGSIRTGGNVPRSFGVGPYLTAGSLAWHSEWGAGNKFYTQVIALSDLPVAGLKTWFINGGAVTLGATEDPDGKGFPAVEFNVNGTDHAWIRFHDGTQTLADDFLVNTVGSQGPRAYSASRVGHGVAYAVVTYRINKEIFTGFPGSKFVLDGVKLYDITKDDTAGGTGAQRWDDPATWGGDGDALPAVQAYNLARGIYYGGAWFYGLQGMTAARLPAAHWIAQIEKCRAPVTGEDGPEPAYRCGGEIAVNSEIGSAFEAILTACAGRMSEVGGFFKVYVGAPDAPIETITDADIVSLAPQSFTPFFGLADTVNGVIASYPSPDEGYVMRSTPPIYNAAYEAEDGGRRLLTDVQLSFVPFPAQAQRLLTGELAAARRARRHTFTLPARFRKVEPGDVIAWNSDRNGYIGKQFRVDGVIDLPNCDLIVDITEVDPSDHGSWDHATDYTPVSPSPLVPVRPTAQGVVGFNPVALDITDAGGAARRPGILMQWNGTVEDIDGIRFELRVKATGASLPKAQTREFAAGELVVEAGLMAATAYEVRAKYIPGSPRAVSWTSWVTVTTNNVRLGGADISPDAIEWTKLGQDVRDQIDSAGDANLSAQAAADAQAAAEAAAAGALNSEAAALTHKDAAETAGAQAVTSAAAADAAKLAAETAKTDAQGSASAAAGSASAASASETAAGLSASAAETSKVEATTAQQYAARSVALSGPAILAAPAEQWTEISIGVHSEILKPPANAADLVEGDPDFGAGYLFPGAANSTIGQAWPFAWNDTAVYSVRVLLKVVSDGASGGCKFRIGGSVQAGTAMLQSNTQTSGELVSAADRAISREVWFTRRGAGSMPALPSGVELVTFAAQADGGDRFYPHFRQNYGDETDAVTMVASIEVRDITAQVDALISQEVAGGSASAAATSATAAAASETAAGSSASAAETSRLAAETAQGNAASSASAAADSATAAAASESAAGSSASAAQSSRLAAETARTGAEVAEASAVSSASDAASSSSSAAVSSGISAAAGTRAAFASAGVSNPGFEAGAVGATGAPSGWLFAAASATAPDELGLSGNVDPASPHASEKSFGSEVIAGGSWWRIGKRFATIPGQNWKVSYRIWANDNIDGTATGNDFIGEDDAFVHFIWYDEAGAQVGESATYTAAYAYSLAGLGAFKGVWWRHSVNERTAPTDAAYLEVWFVAVDGNNSAQSSRTDYASWATGNAAVLIDDVEITSSNGGIAEVPAAVADAAASASAAASSASAASASETAAGSSASAAETSRLAAETAKSDAQSSASAAASSASAASASETAAGSSASAAETSRLAAETAKGDAQSSASAAASSASAASASETAAGQSATSASQSANSAGTSASGASASATSAASSATNAADSASAASQSATVAAQTLTQFRLGHTDFQRILDAVSALDGVGGPETATDGGDVLGQGGSVISATDASAGFDTTGSTNGIRIQIPAEQALQFAGRRIRVDVLAKQPASNPASQFVAAYSTADVGNSGKQVFSPAADWAWYSFYYAVPNPNSGGVDWVGLWGDNAQSGKKTQFARVLVRMAPLADDIPEIGVVQAEATASSQAITDLAGNAAASLVFRAKAGGATGAVEIVAADNVDQGAASKVSLTASEIELDGITVFSGNELKSSNFVDGAAGWRIKNGGDAQFNNLIVRGSLTANAASNGGESIAYTTKTRIGGEDQGVVLTSLNLGPTSYDEAWLIGFAGEIRGESNAGNTNALIAKIRTKTGSTWSAWGALWTSPTEVGNVWTPYYYGEIWMGDFDDVQIGLAAFPNRNFSLWGVNNVYNLSLYARVAKR